MPDGIAEPPVKTHVGHVAGSLFQPPQKNTLGPFARVSYCPGSSGMPTLRAQQVSVTNGVRVVPACRIASL
eukprot:6427762-Pyramimonas_sp.AAC.1